MLFTFLATLIVHSIKKVHENYCCSRNIACQVKRTDWILRIFTFNDKNPLYLPIILTLHFFDGQSDQGVIHLVIKPVDISQTFRIVGLSYKYARFFQPSFYFSFPFLDYTLHKFWDQSSLPLLSMLLASIWKSSLAQASMLLLCQYAATSRRGRALIYFCKVDHSRISINFSRNWLGLNNLCEIL